MKKILVAGGAGFLGSHLCARLIREHNYVICVDNFITGNFLNLSPIKDHPNFKFLIHDVVDPLEIDVKIDQIYNLACPASPIHYQLNPLKTLKSSVLGAINLLDLAHKNGARILQASTSEIYGDPEVHPQPESYWGNVNCIGVRSCYDEGKRCAETLFFDYWRQYKVDIRVIRIFNTYGPRMHLNDGRVISNFIVQALKNEPITIYGDGSQTRSFCYVDNLIEGMVRFMNCASDLTGPMNMGNPEQYTICALAEKIIKMAGSTSKIVFEPLPQDDPKQRCPDTRLAKKVLNWEASISLEEGLQHTMRYFHKLIFELETSNVKSTT